MGYPAKPASSVLYVSELDRSVTFYRDLFECEVALRSAEAALLLTSDGFQLYIIERGKHAQRHPNGLGYHLLMWATESHQGLERLQQTLQEMGSYIVADTATSQRASRSVRDSRVPPCRLLQHTTKGRRLMPGTTGQRGWLKLNIDVGELFQGTTARATHMTPNKPKPATSSTARMLKAGSVAQRTGRPATL